MAPGLTALGRLLPSSRTLSRDGQLVVLLVVLFLIRGAIYALVSPPFSLPDEKGHYDYVASLYESGGASVLGKERHQPSLYYWLSLPAYALFAGGPADLQVYALAASEPTLRTLIAVRLLSVLMTAPTVVLAYLTARAVFPANRLVYLGTAAFVALVPAYGWLAGSVNNDNLARLAAASVIFLAMRGLVSGFGLWSSLVAVGLAGLALASKPTTVPVVGVFAVILAGRALTRMLAGRRRTSAYAVSLGLLFAIGLAAWQGWSSAGSSLGNVLRRWVAPEVLSPEGAARFLSSFSSDPYTYQFKTFWGSFLNDSAQLPSPVYWLLAALTGVSLAGLLHLSFRALLAALTAGTHRAVMLPMLQVLALAAFIAGQWAISFARFYSNTALEPPDIIAGWDDDFALLSGRFLFPVMIPLGMVFTRGLEDILPRGWAKSAPWVLLALLLVVDMISIGTLMNGGYSWVAYPSE